MHYIIKEKNLQIKMSWFFSSNEKNHQIISTDLSADEDDPPPHTNIFIVVQDDEPLHYFETKGRAEKFALELVENIKRELLSADTSVSVAVENDEFIICKRNLMRIISYDELVSIVSVKEVPHGVQKITSNNKDDC